MFQKVYVEFRHSTRERCVWDRRLSIRLAGWITRDYCLAFSFADLNLSINEELRLWKDPWWFNFLSVWQKEMIEERPFKSLYSQEIWSYLRETALQWQCQYGNVDPGLCLGIRLHLLNPVAILVHYPILIQIFFKLNKRL